MFKLAKYLKPFTVLILTAIILLFVQAMCDLSLPDYMSNIVNVGIQQGGIENAVPKAVRQSTMDKLTIFMNDSEKAEVIKSYTLIDKSNADYDEYIKDYPVLATEPIYTLNNIDKTEIDMLNPIMGKAFLAVSGIDKAKTNAKDGVIEFNGTKIPANVDLFTIIAKQPASQREQITSSMNEKFAALGDKMVTQAAVVPIKAEYVALGIDIDKIQSNYIINAGVLMLLISLISAVCYSAGRLFICQSCCRIVKKLT